MRKLTKYEIGAMWLFHNEYAELGLGAIDYWKGLSKSDKRLVEDMVREIESAYNNACTGRFATIVAGIQRLLGSRQ